MLDAVAPEYGDLNKLNSYTRNQLQALAPATVAPMLQRTMNAPREKQACLDRVRADLLAQREQELSLVKNMDAYFVLPVLEKANYEGNYVVIAESRGRGSDQRWRYKLLLKSIGGSWVVARKEEIK